MPYSFRNDYSEGACPAVLRALADTNQEQTVGYGLDPYCAAAADTIRRLCAAPEADVHFLVGGTQVNFLVTEALLQPYEAAISPATGHIAVHETGAVEAAGHKVCTVESPNGKLTPAHIEAVLAAHNGTEHMVLPRLVYISDTAETGAVYSKAELAALRRCCSAHGLYLYLDGARLGSALTSPENDLTLPDLAALTDAFTIGGTKNGALFGEALVLPRPLPRFRWYMKRRGAVLAKGRLLGIQFQALLEDGLYFDLARHANALAFRLRDGMMSMGYSFPLPSPSNQQFPLLPNETVEKLRAMGYEFETDHLADERQTCIRLVTSWATPEKAVEDFLRDLAGC